MAAPKVRWFIAALALIVALAPVTSGIYTIGRPSKGSTASAAANPIQHVVVIMQENRSFDSYFGTYPGADGLANAQATATAMGMSGVCLPDPVHGGCDAPFHDSADLNYGANHDNPS